MNNEPCPYCAANDLADDCWHTPEMWTLMVAISEANGDGSPEVAVGFEDDADGLIGVVGAPPYTVAIVPPDDRMQFVEFACVINGILCAAFNHHGDTGPLEPIARLVAVSGEQAQPDGGMQR